MSITQRSLIAFALLGLTHSVAASGCCFGGTPTVTPPVTAPLPMGAPTPGAPGAPTAAPAAVIAPQAITLAPGFAPDPTVVQVTAGGPVDGDTMVSPSEWCPGNYPAAAQVTLTTSAALPNLRVVVRGPENQDTTLAIRFADGHVVCNDDGAGWPNPAIDTTDFPAGTHQIFVGTFHTGEALPATVGFTTNLATQPANL